MQFHLRVRAVECRSPKSPCIHPIAGNDRHPSPSTSIHVNSRPPLPETRPPLQRRRRRRPAISPPAKNMARQTPYQSLPRRQRIQILHKLPSPLRPPPPSHSADLCRSNSRGYYTFPVSLRLASTSSRAS